MAAGSGAVTLIAFYLAVALTEGYMGLVLLAVPGTMVLACIMGIVREALLGFQHNCS